MHACGELRPGRVRQLPADRLQPRRNPSGRSVRSASCNLSQATFREGALRAVAFEDCDLRGADFTGARFQDVEVRGCKLDGLRGAGTLRGIRMPWADIVENAGLFAGACGVEALD